MVVLERLSSNGNRGARPSAPPEPAADRSDRPRRTSRTRTRLNNRIRGEVVRLYEAGQSSRAVAAQAGIGKATVLKILADADVQMRPSHVTYRGQTGANRTSLGEGSPVTRRPDTEGGWARC